MRSTMDAEARRSRVRTLISDRGTHREVYVDPPAIGPLGEATPPLVVSVGGPRTTAAPTPVADIVDMKLPGLATTGKGSFNTRSQRAVTPDEIIARLDDLHARRSDVPLGMFVAAGCGHHLVIDILHKQLEGSVFADLFGSPQQVAEGLRRLAALGSTGLPSERSASRPTSCWRRPCSPDWISGP